MEYRETFLGRTYIWPSCSAHSKHDALRALSTKAASCTGLDVARLCSALEHREQLGSTSIGDGVALPHSKIEGLSCMVCIFTRLRPAIPFDALDEQPVDLIFLLLVPQAEETSNLKALSALTRLLNKPQARQNLRACPNNELANHISQLLAPQSRPRVQPQDTPQHRATQPSLTPSRL